MKILTYNEFFEREAMRRVGWEIELGRKTALRYGKELVEEQWYKIQQQLYVLMGCVGKLKDKNVLDLGCGCNYSFVFDGDRDRAGETYSPWLCRALHEIGARAIGVDNGSLEGELFEHHEGVNLAIPNSLGFIPDYSIDIANARLLFSSPEVFGNSEKLKQELLLQMERIVKPGGYFVYQN